MFLVPRDPSWHGLAVSLIRRAKGLAKIRLFVGTDEEGEADEQEEPVDDLWQRPDPDDIPSLDQQRADNHRVADIVIQPVDDHSQGSEGVARPGMCEMTWNGTTPGRKPGTSSMKRMVLKAVNLGKSFP